MENYNDEKLAENFETIARAYSKSMKNKGFIFIKLEEEEFSLLLDEINASLDKKTSDKIHQYLLNSDLTFVEVTHHYEANELGNYDNVIDLKGYME